MPAHTTCGVCSPAVLPAKPHATPTEHPNQLYKAFVVSWNLNRFLCSLPYHSQDSHRFKLTVQFQPKSSAATMFSASVSKTTSPVAQRNVAVRAVRPAAREQASKARGVVVALSAALMLAVTAAPAEALLPKFEGGVQRREGFKEQNSRLQSLFEKDQKASASNSITAQVRAKLSVHTAALHLSPSTVLEGIRAHS